MMKIRNLALLGLIFGGLVMSAQRAAAQQVEPLVDMAFEETRTLPGQSLTLRVTVLVPTWMPKPVVFPSLDQPNLRVRLPSKSTTPTSRNVKGTSWSGVTRRYLLTPMVPGRFTVAGQDVQVTYADPETSAPVVAMIEMPSVTLEAVVPDGAEALDPFIAAGDLTLTQEVSDRLTDLEPGESVKRRVVAQVKGTSPIVVPPLQELPPAFQGFAAYADAPEIEEREDRGVLSGTRSETVTLMVQGKGQAHLPAIEIGWYDIDEKSVKKARVEAVDLSAVGGPPPSVRDRLAALDGTRIARLAGLLLGIGLVVRLVLPRLLHWLREKRARRRASKAYAAKAVLAAIHDRDLAATHVAFDAWARRSPVTPRTEIARFGQALLPIGSARYGREAGDDRDQNWRQLAETFNSLRDQSGNPRSENKLAPLNP